jgi:hypothetical protein
MLRIWSKLGSVVNMVMEVRFEVLSAASIKMAAVFCSEKSATVSETPVKFCQTAWSNKPEDSYLHDKGSSDSIKVGNVLTNV